jgi:hypothetical protein
VATGYDEEVARAVRVRQDDHTGACKRWWLAAFLLLGPRRCERTRVAHVVPGGLDPAVGTLDVRDAELVDVAVEGIGDAAHVPAEARLAQDDERFTADSELIDLAADDNS